jgi:hypothetical protein
MGKEHASLAAVVAAASRAKRKSYSKCHGSQEFANFAQMALTLPPITVPV